MPESRKRPKPVVVEQEYKSYNPTKGKFGKVLIVILAVGMFLGLLIAAIYGMIQVLIN
ncbi:MAG: hypothetical protein WC479_03610 [Candidatus Izemoplasmatales bacterium]|jgi:hypothetical protein|nr:hypothetical protein [Candidatus Izemoplasmatales bacterium]MDD3864771.1 hypothetical protein [Candidatus Izemoplasmatales bacterium]